ncbi:MAG TPA: translation initiation factor IF-2 [Xanthomonadales bacterium]|nr:translation initiation factor IF-2 [Xanthomonadales bacterium]
MSDVTVRQLASVLNLQVDKLLEQLAEAGMKFSGADQVVTSTEKVKLLGFLRRTHGKRDTQVEQEAGPQQITLRRKKVSELTVSSGAAKGKTVAVEVRQKRTYVKRSVVQDEPGSPDAEREEALRLLKESETRRAAEEASLREADERRRLEEEAKKQEVERKRLEAEAAASAAAGEPKRPDEEPKRAHDKPRPAGGAKPPARKEPRAGERDEPRRHKGVHGSHQMQEETVPVEDPALGRYVRGELHLADPGAASRRIKRKPRQRVIESRTGSGGPHGFSRPTEKQTREIPVGDSIAVGDLAQKLAVKGAEVVKALFKMGVMATINQVVDHDTAVLVAEELGHKVVRAKEHDAESALIAQGTEASAEAAVRPPVVTIMGHVDHGKTSLLDYIRRTKVAAGEAGGITQHIGAYHVRTDKGVITFLDTPGHAAFTAMRARGAKLTDIVVLVVAADDGVMPQTIEAIQHARAAGVPLIVAMNKIDKPEANPDRVKQGLIQHEVVPEEFGGETIFAPVSAKTGEGVDALLDAILLQAEVMELRAVAEARASGVVVESALDKGRGPVATVLVQQGTLNRGDFIVCGVHYGRVRAMFNEAGEQVQSAGPSIPVVLLGLSGAPDAGDDFAAVADERLAKEVAQQREAKRRESRLFRATTKIEDIMSQMAQQGEGQRVLNIVVKADVQGSAEALRDALTKISTDAIRVNVIGSGVGGITESDATLAQTSKALLIGFNVRADAGARRIVNEAGLDLRYFSIIYDVIDQVRQVASGLLGTEIREEIIGVAQVRDVFRSSKFGQIAGCMVIEGTVRRNKPIRVLRDNVVVFQGELESLRRFKENVEEVRNGMECGIGVKQYNDVRAGDQIECFERIEVQRVL